MRPIAVRDYQQLLDALRFRQNQLNISRETIDEVAGLPQRYKATRSIPNQGCWPHQPWATFRRIGPQAAGCGGHRSARSSAVAARATRSSRCAAPRKPPAQRGKRIAWRNVPGAIFPKPLRPLGKDPLGVPATPRQPALSIDRPKSHFSRLFVKILLRLPVLGLLCDAVCGRHPRSPVCWRVEVRPCAR